MPRLGAITAVLAFFAASLAMPGVARADPTPAATRALMAAALRNIQVLDRPGSNGYATFWDGNKYVQCGQAKGGGFRCEAAGAAMQPSLAPILTPEKVRGLLEQGWKLDPSFGNYVRVFPAKAPLDTVSAQILLLLTGVYAADAGRLEVETTWVPSEPCPPRNGYSQNLAGMIDDAAAMRATAVYACAFVPPTAAPAGASAALLIARYGPRVTAEIQRLRVNLQRRVYVAFDTDIGYVQCEPQTSPSVIYCEAQSADSWPALSTVLTPDRIARLHAAGFADPGRAPNYWKEYPVEQVGDAAISAEILTLLHDVYGYDGGQPLKIETETGEAP
jgi:hypothetical protein